MWCYLHLICVQSATFNGPSTPERTELLNRSILLFAEKCIEHVNTYEFTLTEQVNLQFSKPCISREKRPVLFKCGFLTTQLSYMTVYELHNQWFKLECAPWMKCMDGSYYLFRLYFNYWQVLITTLNYRYVLSFSWCMFAGSKLLCPGVRLF